ncbi:hypothetical protein KAI46_01200, partial [bacterium]|nr:hypothetical protein [bacterium]
VKTANKVNIKVDKSAPPQKSAKVSSSASVKVSDRKAAVAPPMTAKQIRKLSVEEKDVLVEKGVLKKHHTPFGPVYKRTRTK